MTKNEPLTEERIAEIRSRLHGVSLGEWSHGYSLDVKCNAITCEGRHLFLVCPSRPLEERQERCKGRRCMAWVAKLDDSGKPTGRGRCGMVGFLQMPMYPAFTPLGEIREL